MNMTGRLKAVGRRLKEECRIESNFQFSILHYRLSAPRMCSQLSDLDVLVPGFAGRAAVNLQADQAALLELFVRLGVIDRFQAVQPEFDVPPLAADHIIVPIV